MPEGAPFESAFQLRRESRDFLHDLVDGARAVARNRDHILVRNGRLERRVRVENHRRRCTAAAATEKRLGPEAHHSRHQPEPRRNFAMGSTSVLYVPCEARARVARRSATPGLHDSCAAAYVRRITRPCRERALGGLARWRGRRTPTGRSGSAVHWGTHVSRPKAARPAPIGRSKRVSRSVVSRVTCGRPIAQGRADLEEERET